MHISLCIFVLKAPEINSDDDSVLVVFLFFRRGSQEVAAVNTGHQHLYARWSRHRSSKHGRINQAAKWCGGTLYADEKARWKTRYEFVLCLSNQVSYEPKSVTLKHLLYEYLPVSDIPWARPTQPSMPPGSVNE